MQRTLSTKLFLAIAVTVAVIVLVATAVFNLRADRWGVFVDDYQTFYGIVRPNRHWLKTKFLTQSDHDYDCVLFGSSRVGAIDPSRLPGRCYNFWHAGGLPANHLVALDAIIRSGVNLERVYLALDDISYFWDPEDNRSHYMRRGYPNTLSDWVAGHVFYLALPMEVTSLGQALGNIPKHAQPMYVLDPQLDWQRIDEESRTFYQQPAEQDKLFRSIHAMPSVRVAASSYRGQEAARDIRSFVALAAEHGIKVELLFNPLHYKTYLSRDYELITDFKRRIAEIQPFYDFTGLNQFTIDNRYWKETSHYSSLVGDVILDVILSGQERNDGFGRLVRAGNLKRLELEQLERDVAVFPSLLRNEGLMYIPPRFFQTLKEADSLSEASLYKPPDVATDALIEGGDIILSRKNAMLENRPGVWTRLAQDEMFVLRFGVDSRERSRLTFTLRWDESLDGDAWRRFRYILSPGRNEGHVAGYVTRVRPPLRIQLISGEVHQSWDPLELYTISGI